MADDKPSVERPLWVRIALCGVPNRGWAWACFWFSIVLTAACIAYGFINALFFTGSSFSFAALGYYLAIKWVDKNDHW